MKNKLFRRAIPALLLSATAFAIQHLPAEAYTLDKTNRVITVAPTGNYTTDIRNAISYLVNRSDKTSKWTLRFQPGKYSLTLPMYSVGLQNVDLVSDPANPAVLAKASNFSGNEYLFYTRMSNNITMRGLTFYGKTTFASNANPVWTDQGVYFGSSRYILVDQCKFYNFGNAALRVTTDNADPIKGVNSFDTKVTKNTFNNIYQISTTSNDDVHGATARYLFEGNNIANLRASLKFATRTPGAKDVWIRNNTINGANIFGIEMDNYSNFEVSGNTFQNINSVSVNMYTNVRAPKGFQWGDNITIKGNTFKNVNRGIRFANDRFSDGYQALPHNFVADNNTFNGVTTTATYNPAISVTSGKVDGVKISYNKFSAIANKKYISTGSAVNVSLLGNLVEGLAYGPQPSTTTPTPTPTPTPTVTAPAAPTNLTGSFDGSTKVALSWKDNATNETGQEIWIRREGGMNQLLAKVAADRTTFTHTITGTKPTVPYYYAVRAVNGSTASALSTAYKESYTVASVPAPAPTTTALAAPTSLVGQYNGSTKVALSWKDNASGETGQEIWVKQEGGQYALLAKLYADKTTFTHTLSGNKPTRPYYYAVRAVSGSKASSLSTAAKIDFAASSTAFR